VCVIHDVKAPPGVDPTLAPRGRPPAWHWLISCLESLLVARVFCVFLLRQLPAAGESGTASVVAAASKADDIGVVARPLAPPEVGPLPDGVETGEEEDKGDSEVDGEGEEEEDDDDEALVEAVETLLREVEVRQFFLAR